jgi:hypothetical protein
VDQQYAHAVAETSYAKLDDRAAEIEAVMDAAGFGQAAFLALLDLVGVGIDASSASGDPARGPWRSTASSCQVPGTPRNSTLPRSSNPVPEPAVGPRCAARTAPWRWSRRAHRGFSPGWPTSLTGESRSDISDADASVLGERPRIQKLPHQAR